ncbi:hypothetical protein [Shewanella sp. 0m-4]
MENTESMENLDNLEIENSQAILLKITKVVETECHQDACALLEEGFVLLGINSNVFEDSENRFVYSLGFPKPLDKLSDWASANF